VADKQHTVNTEENTNTTNIYDDVNGMGNANDGNKITSQET